uniref:Uncharacterized protein n=1 Tax=Anguilla anguilla TaxID=7936 RepID=A0A0E9VRP5_ANGAN
MHLITQSLQLLYPPQITSLRMQSSAD